MKKIITILLLVVVSTSCSLIFNGKKTTIVSSTDSTHKTAYVSPRVPYSEKARSRVIIETDDDRFKIKSRWYYPAIVTEEREGYLTQTEVIAPKTFNFFKLINLAATIPMLIADPDVSPVFYASMMYSIFYGWWELFLAPNIISCQKELVLPPMKPNPSRQAEQNYISLDTLSISYDVEDTKIIYYSKASRLIKGVKKNNNKNKVNYDGSQKQFETYMAVSMMDLLSDFGYADTGKSLFGASSFNTYSLAVEIQKIELRKRLSFGGYADITARFTLKTSMEDKELVSETVSASSILMSSQTKDHNDAMVMNALQHCLVKFLENEDVQKLMVSSDSQLADKTAKWDLLEINANGEYCSTQKEAISAVVTVINDKSHGSGCVISTDGYIITNYHVVAQNKGGLYIKSGENEKVKCEIVRFNEKMDLALIKTEAMNVKPLKLSSSTDIPTGHDVYAIGTPADIELGQSISKGIISGKRKINEILMIQTDVSVNPGNSGGALTGPDGVLLGIVSSKVFGTGLEGLGFAIPAYYIEEALKIKIQK